MLVYSYITAAVVSVLAALFLTPSSIKIGRRIGALSTPKDAEIARPPASNMGGVAVLISILLAIIAAFLIFPKPFEGYGLIVLGIVLGTLIVSVMGILDDRLNLGPGLKFAVQVVSALIIIPFGVEISFISNPFNSLLSLGAFSIPVTVLWVVGVMNAVNFVDGLDGLAPGVLAIAGLSLFAICAYLNLPFLALIFLSIFGANFAFLRYNYPPAKVILGNVGAYSLGYLFAVASIIQPVKVSTAMVLFVPMLALGFPMVEMIVTVLRRLLKRKKIYQRDAEHLHHLLLSLGLPPQLVDWIFTR